VLPFANGWWEIPYLSGNCELPQRMGITVFVRTALDVYRPKPAGSISFVPKCADLKSTPCTPAKTSPSCTAVWSPDRLIASGSLCKNSASREVRTSSDLADPDALGRLCRVFCEERDILELPVSNRMSVVGVDTVSRPGLVSGTDDVPDCAGQS